MLVATSMADRVIVDASAMVDLLTGSPVSQAVRDRLRAHELHAPAHFDAEVLSALGRLERGGHLSPDQVEERIDRLAAVWRRTRTAGPREALLAATARRQRASLGGT